MEMTTCLLHWQTLGTSHQKSSFRLCQGPQVAPNASLARYRLYACNETFSSERPEPRSQADHPGAPVRDDDASNTVNTLSIWEIFQWNRRFTFIQEARE